MSEFEVVPGSVRCYATDENGHAAEDFQLRPSREGREHELAEARARLQPVIDRGREAEEKLAAEALRRLRSPGEREFGDASDAAATPAEDALYAALATWRRG